MRTKFLKIAAVLTFLAAIFLFARASENFLTKKIDAFSFPVFLQKNAPIAARENFLRLLRENEKNGAILKFEFFDETAAAKKLQIENFANFNFENSAAPFVEIWPHPRRFSEIVDFLCRENFRETLDFNFLNSNFENRNSIAYFLQILFFAKIAFSFLPIFAAGISAIFIFRISRG